MTECEDQVDLCPLDDIAPDSARGFDLDDSGRDDLFVVRSSHGVFAYRNNCPHQNATMPWRRNEYLNATRDRIVCSAHGAEFAIATGECTSGAALGLCLDAVDLQVTTEGVLRVKRSDVLPDSGTQRRRLDS